MKAFVLVGLFALAWARDECDENEHFESCGTACPLTCENHRNPPKFCILRCDIGCHCDVGYVRSADGRCVKPEECPASAPEECGENQRYATCGSACPLTCENRQNPPRICPAMCVIGCECQDGYVKTNDGRCVKPEQCPSYVRPIEKSCDEQPNPGYCLGYFPSWYYDTKTQSCQAFVYGGCQGNGNRYESEEECMENCASKSMAEACQQDKVVGPCRAAFRRFYFNKESGKCEVFIYGGCNGNSNNFNSQEDCEAVCAA